MKDFSKHINFYIGNEIKEVRYALLVNNDWLAYNLYHNKVKRFPSWEVIVGKNKMLEIYPFKDCWLTLCLDKPAYKGATQHFMLTHKDSLNYKDMYEVSYFCSIQSFMWLCNQVIK